MVLWSEAIILSLRTDFFSAWSIRFSKLRVLFLFKYFNKFYLRDKMLNSKFFCRKENKERNEIQFYP